MKRSNFLNRRSSYLTRESRRRENVSSSSSTASSQAASSTRQKNPRTKILAIIQGILMSRFSGVDMLDTRRNQRIRIDNTYPFFTDITSYPSHICICSNPIIQSEFTDSDKNPLPFQRYCSLRWIPTGWEIVIGKRQVWSNSSVRFIFPGDSAAVDSRGSTW